MNEFSDNDFHNISKSIITEYIRSVLFIDDEWPEIEEDFTPDESHLVMDELPLESDIQDESEPPLGKMLQAHRSNDRSLLEFKKAVEEEGIIFHGLAYRHKKHKDIVAKLACRADVIVLDWELTAGSGEETIHILKNLVKGGGLRFICIFTGKERIEDIKNQIDEAFSFMKIKDESPSEFRRDNLIIILRSKPKKITESSNHAVEPKNLLNQAINAFSKVYKGFVQLMLLEITNKHRFLLPKVLEQIDSDIDSAYIAEATNSKSPLNINNNDSFIRILMDEWHAQLKLIESIAFSEKALKAYCSTIISMNDSDKKNISLPLIKNKNPDQVIKLINSWISNPNTFYEWLKSGYSNCEIFPKKERESAKLDILNRLIQTNTEPKKSMLKLDSLFHQQQELPKAITQGTVLWICENYYLICVTPACDAERPGVIMNIYSFLLAKEISIDNHEKRDSYIVIIDRDHKKNKILEVQSKYYLTFYIHKPDIISKQNIIAAIGMPEEVKIKCDQKVELKPIAQLRTDHALSLSAKAVAYAARVGVDRVEYIRNRMN